MASISQQSQGISVHRAVPLPHGTRGCPRTNSGTPPSARRGNNREKKNTRMKHLAVALVCNLHTHPWKVLATPFSHSWKPSNFGDIIALRKAYDIHLGKGGRKTYMGAMINITTFHKYINTYIHPHREELGGHTESVM